MALLAACLVALAFARADSDVCTPKVNNLAQVLRGYNAFQGDPLGDSGTDPGFRDALLFHETYDTKVTGDDCFKVPDGMELLRETVCTLAFESKKIDTAEDYANRMSVFAHLEGSALPGSFTASAGYNKFVSQSTDQHTTRVETYAQCQQFVVWQIQGKDNGPKKTAEFDAVLTKLKKLAQAHEHKTGESKASNSLLTLHTDSEDEHEETLREWREELFSFFDTWGTHYVRSADLGARFGRVTYLSRQGVKRLEEKNVSATVAAQTAGLAALVASAGGKFEADHTQKVHEDFVKATTEQHQISLGPVPQDVNLNDNSQAVAKWAEEAMKYPLPLKYRMKLICEFFDEPWFHCEKWLSSYCEARLPTWSKTNPHATCKPKSRPPVLVPKSKDCFGTPPNCCAGGLPGATGTKVHETVVEFQLFPTTLGEHDAIQATWTSDTCFVPPGQPFGGAGQRGLWSTGNTIHMSVGHKNWRIPGDFSEGLEVKNLLGPSGGTTYLPEKLYFFFVGNLTLHYTPEGKATRTAKFSKFRLGMGRRWMFWDSGWIGSPRCISADSKSVLLECQADDDSWWQFRGKGWRFPHAFLVYPFKEVA